MQQLHAWERGRLARRSCACEHLRARRPRSQAITNVELLLTAYDGNICMDVRSYLDQPWAIQGVL